MNTDLENPSPKVKRTYNRSGKFKGVNKSTRSTKRMRPSVTGTSNSLELAHNQLTNCQQKLADINQWAQVIQNNYTMWSPKVMNNAMALLNEMTTL